MLTDESPVSKRCMIILDFCNVTQRWFVLQDGPLTMDDDSFTHTDAACMTTGLAYAW